MKKTVFSATIEAVVPLYRNYNMLGLRKNGWIKLIELTKWKKNPTQYEQVKHLCTTTVGQSLYFRVSFSWSGREIDISTRHLRTKKTQGEGNFSNRTDMDTWPTSVINENDIFIMNAHGMNTVPAA